MTNKKRIIMSDKELDEIISLNEKLRMENKRLRREFKYKKDLYKRLNKI